MVSKKTYRKIGILGPLKEEISDLMDSIQNRKETIKGGRSYFVGAIGNTEVVAAQSRCGKVASASTALTLFHEFNVDFLIVTGVAGAVDPRMDVGDVIVATGLYQHDMDARPIFPQFEIPLTGRSLYEPKQEHIEALSSSAKTFLDSTDEKHSALSEFGISKPSVYEGIIASGDIFVQDPLSHANLKLPKENVLAVEMEGGAVAQVCEEHGVDYVVLRTISDRADHSAAIDFQKFLSLAGLYSHGILSPFIENLNN